MTATEATWTDPRTGLNETVAYLGSPDDRILTITYRPVRPNGSGVVICPSLHHDLVKNFRREVLVARALAAAGCLVQRFQYRGTGNSDGEAQDLTRESLIADAMTATHGLRDVAGPEALAFIGTRFGGLVAASVAASVPGCPVALLEPTVDARQFFREGIRARLMQSIVAPGSNRPTTEQLTQQLRDDGFLDVLGYPLGLPLFESSEGWTLQEAAGPSARDLLVLQLGEGTVRAEYQRLAGDLRAASWNVDVELIQGRESWWYLDERELVQVGRTQAAGSDGAEEVPNTEPPWTSAVTASVLRWLAPRLVANTGGSEDP